MYLRRRTDDVYIVRIQPQLSVRGSWGTAPSVFWFLLYEQKERLGGEPYRLCTLHNLRDAEGDHHLDPKILLHTFIRKKQPPRQAVQTMPLQKAPPRRQAKGNFGIICAIKPSVSRSADTSPYTGEPLGRCDAEGEMKLA